MTQSPFSYLVLVLTTRCNLSCLYCYMDCCATGDAMDPAMLDAVTREIKRSPGPVHFQITGGEPLLEKGLLKKAIKKIRKDVPDCTISLQTNATLITSEDTEFFKEGRIQLGISLDGGIEVHDSVRGGFKETMRGLRLLEENGVSFRTTAVVTRPSLSALPRLAMLLSSFKTCQGLGLDLLVKKGRGEASFERLFPEEQDIGPAMEELGRCMRFLEERGSGFRLRELERLKRKRSGAGKFCHAQAGSALCLVPGGILYPCSQTCNDEDFYLGTIKDLEAGRLKRETAVKSGHVTGCNGCPLKGRCPGECPSRLFYNPAQTGNASCVIYRSLWKGYGKKDGQHL